MESIDPFARLIKSLNLFNGTLKRKTPQKRALVEVKEAKEDQEEASVYENPDSFYWGQFLSTDQLSVAMEAINKQSKPFFNQRIIKEFAEKLGGDSLECYKHMYDVRYLWNEKVKEHYKKIYTQHKTIPLVFLSVVKTKEKKIKAIYLWQFNEYCSIMKQKMEIDCSFNRKIFVPHNSMLLLAKFVSSESEELLDGQFLSDSRILIKSRLSDSHLRFREYDMMDLRDFVKINPYEAQAKYAFYCASKLDLSLDESSGGMNCDLSRIRRLAEIELVEYHNSANKTEGVQSLPMFIKIDSQKIENHIAQFDSRLFSEVYSTKINSFTVLIDRKLAKMIVFKKDSLKIIDLSQIGQISSIYENNNGVFYFLNTEGKVFRIDENFDCEELKIQIKAENDVKFLNVNKSDSLVYLEGTKFYSIELKKEEVPRLLFDVEEVEADEEQPKVNRKFIWEVVQDNLVFIRGSFIYFYDMAEKKFETKGLDKIDVIGYWDQTVEWKFLSKKNRLFVMSQIENNVRMTTFTLNKKTANSDENEVKIDQNGIFYWNGNLRPTDDSLFVQITGPNDNILFMRSEDLYLQDFVNQVSDIPNYLFSSFVFPSRGKPLMIWEIRQREKELKFQRERKEEHEKRVEDEVKELEELGEMKMRVNRHLKDFKGGKDHEKERKEKMADLRKAIVRTDQEEGADRLDKRLKDVKEEYMTLYQDLKKDKRQQVKEKEKNKGKERNIERNHKANCE